jgi:hypothetical protein
MGRKGKSILYLTPEEKEYLNYLGNFGIKMENMPLPGMSFFSFSFVFFGDCPKTV